VIAHGGCSDWSSFTQNELNVPFASITFNKMTASYGYADKNGKVMGVSNITCSVPAVVEGIKNSLTSATTSSITSSTGIKVLNLRVFGYTAESSEMKGRMFDLADISIYN
jgi:hypothetical protein